jgi:branched-chain amino acid transport system substrate-binding protein
MPTNIASRSAAVAVALGLMLPWAVAAAPVTVGVLTDMSGDNEAFGGKGSVTAAEMAAEDFGGSVLGEKIRVISADHQNKPDLGSAIARRWYDTEGVDLIVDIPVSSVGLAVQEVSRNAKKIVLNSGSSTSHLVEDACSPFGAQWSYDGYSLAKGVAGTLVTTGAKKWFMITADYAGGLSVEADMERFLKAAGGEVVGRTRQPVGTTDFSSALLLAQASGADVIGVANFSADTVNTLKQAQEFGITAGGQRLAVFFMSEPQIHAAGADTFKGLVFVTSYVWNRNDETRAWSKRFFARRGAMPSDFQASVYSATLQYLKAVKAAGSRDAVAVMKQIHEMPVDDQYDHGGIVRANGSHVHDLYLVQVKGSSEQSEPWDDMRVIKTIPGNEAFRPLAEEKACPLVR